MTAKNMSQKYKVEKTTEIGAEQDCQDLWRYESLGGPGTLGSHVGVTVATVVVGVGIYDCTRLARHVAADLAPG